ncbi:MAG: GH92 family glycosyl hydrolase, partial [Anaerolineae bacterium]|nr:GH92 family glycosyl hydrolase [Anaerolineae bacterium]
MIKRPVEWVDPLIDTANRRFFFFSSACRPFGMVNLSPDTVNGGAWGSGYRYTEPYVLWFSHVHAWQLSGIPVKPATGPFRGHLGCEAYRSRFSHDDEIVQPGYHALVLQDDGIRVELTATDRVGFHRYTFPQSTESHVLFDLGAEVGPSRMSDASVQRVDGCTLEGYVENDATRRRPKPTRIYFVATFDRPFDSMGAWQEGRLLQDIDGISGPESGIWVRYQTAQDEQIQLKVAISYCSVEQARLNLEAELPHWDFDRVRQEAYDTWDRWLGRIEVQGGTNAQKTKFYTDLYHALLGRRRVSDHNGAYLDMTGDEPVVRRIALDERGRPHYEHHNSDAFWGAQWTLNVLWPLAYPAITHNFCHTLLDVYRNGGLIPRGPSGGNYTFVMISPTSTPLLVSAYQKGIRSFDVEQAYEGMVKNHGPGGLMSKAGYEHDSCLGGGVESYLERGYVPLGIQAHAFHCDGASQTLEYAYCDWCLAQMAEVTGKTGDARVFLHRAGNYRNLYDAGSGFMRPRLIDGSWLEDFDPMSPQGWCEG